MSDDASYTNFLEQANQDTGGASTQSHGDGKVKLKTVTAEVPGALRDVDAFYVSDADEPFEPVSLGWAGKGTLDTGAFQDLVGHGGEVEEMSAAEFDPKGQYQKVLQAVEGEVDGPVKVFRLETGGARAEYWVVGVQKKAKKVVGVRAKAVES